MTNDSFLGKHQHSIDRMQMTWQIKRHDHCDFLAQAKQQHLLQKLQVSHLVLVKSSNNKGYIYLNKSLWNNSSNQPKNLKNHHQGKESRKKSSKKEKSQCRLKIKYYNVTSTKSLGQLTDHKHHLRVRHVAIYRPLFTLFPGMEQ